MTDTGSNLLKMKCDFLDSSLVLYSTRRGQPGLNFCCTNVLGTAAHTLEVSTALRLFVTAIHILEVRTVLRLFVTAVDILSTAIYTLGTAVHKCTYFTASLYLRATAPLPLFPNFLRFRFLACPHFSPLPIYKFWVKTQTSDIVPFVKRLIVQKLCIVVLSLN